MSKLSNLHKMIGTKGLTPKEKENTLFKKAEEMLQYINYLQQGIAQRLTFSISKETSILNSILLFIFYIVTLFTFI